MKYFRSAGILAGAVFFSSFALSFGTLSFADEPQAEQEPSLTIKVSAKRNKVENTSQVSQTEIGRDQIQLIPRGDQNSLPQILEATTPSVVSGGYGRVFTRQDENGLQYQVDGIQLPDLPDNAIGDYFNPRNVEKMEVTLGALPAEFGDRPAGVINFITPEGTEKDSVSAEINYGSYNTFSPQGEIRGSSKDTRVRYSLAVNYYRTDRGLDTPQPVSGTQEGLGTSDAVHDYSDGNNEFARLDYMLTNEDKMTLILMNREDFYQIPNFPSSYSPQNSLFGPNGDAYGNDPLNYTPPNTNDSQTETTLFTELVWKHTFSENSFLQVGTFYKYFQINVQNDPSNDLAAINNPSLTANPSPDNASLYENRHTNSMGLKADYKLRTDDNNVFKAGLSSKAYQTAGTATVSGANQGSGPAVVSATDSSPEYGSVEGVYIQDEWTISKKLFVNVGLRYDYMQANYSDAQPSYDQFEPRILLSYMVVPGTKVHAFYGRLFNVPLFEDLHDTFASLSNQQGLGSVAPFDIKPEKDNYYEAGVDQQLGPNQVASFTVYYKQATDLLDDAQLLNTALQDPFNWAQGYAYGAEFSLHGNLTPHFSNYINYSYGVAKGMGISGGLFANPLPNPLPGYQVLDHVQRHTANAGITYDDKGYWGTLIGRYGSGLPTGPNNQFSAPGHYTWDATLGYEFMKKDWTEHLKLSFDVLNIFDNKYAIFIANGFNGSYYAAGREYMGHISKEF